MKKEVSGEPDCRWEEFQRYAADRLKTPVTIMGLALQRMDGAQNEGERREALEMAKRGQQNLVTGSTGSAGYSPQKTRRV